MLKLFSNNVAGFKLKVNSLKSQLNDLNAAIFTLQNTHVSLKGKIKIDGYEILKSIRNKYTCTFKSLSNKRVLSRI